MGTRNLICIVKDNQFKLGKYCQWDGYLEGQGQSIAKFIIKNLQNNDGLNRFSNNVDSLVVISNKQEEEYWKKAGADMEVSDLFKEKHPQLHRDCGADILDMIFNTTGLEVSTPEIEFANDALFCEYCYVLDLSNEMLEIYINDSADNRSLQGSRFDKLVFFKKISFKDININTMAEFASEL
jgi:hypothetical protein